MRDTTGSSPPPPPFRYREVYERGKPEHEKNDSFSIRHPAMDLSRRAKIFSPFDALKGFHEELAAAEAEISDTFADDDTGPVGDPTGSRI